MTQYSSPRRRALIVEDEVLIAFDLSRSSADAALFSLMRLSNTRSQSAMRYVREMSQPNVCL
jgi:hypothetical protein